MGIPIINPKAHILKRYLNEALLQDPYASKILVPEWKRYEPNQTLQDCILSETPTHPKSKRMLLVWFFNCKKAYLYNPDSGSFYYFGSMEFSRPVSTCILDVQVHKQGINTGTLYLRDVFVWDNTYVSDLSFHDRKQICDLICLNVSFQNAWLMYPCSFIYKSRHKKQDKLYYILYETFVPPYQSNITNKMGAKEEVNDH